MKIRPEHLPAFDSETGDVNAIVETPRGSRYKFAYEKTSGLFQLKKALPAGLVLPFDFGFIPSTRAPDGDPLDVLLIAEEKLFPGCLVKARLLGVLVCEQGKKGKLIRNDRVVAEPIMENVPARFHSINELDHELIYQLEKFFILQHELEGKKFKVLETRGPKKAEKLVKAAVRKK